MQNQAKVKLKEKVKNKEVAGILIYDTKDIVEMFGISLRTLRRHLSNGVITPRVKRGAKRKKFYYTNADIIKLFNYYFTPIGEEPNPSDIREFIKDHES